MRSSLTAAASCSSCLSGGDVLDVGEQHRLALDVDGGHVHLGGELGAVVAQADGLDPAQQHRPVLGQVVVAVPPHPAVLAQALRQQEVVHPSSEELGGGVAVHGLGGRVDQDDAPVPVGDDDRGRGRIHDGAVHLRAIGPGLLHQGTL